MWTTLALLTLGGIVPDGAASDPDQSAEVLGIDALEARSVADDARAFQPPADTPPPTTESSGWASLLPNLSVGFRYQSASTLRDTSGGFRAELPQSTVLLVSATWPLPDSGKGSPSHRRWLAQAEGRVASEPAPVAEAEPPGPTVQELQQAALEASPLHLIDVASLRSRARAAAWLPDLSAEYQRNVGNIDMLGVSSGEGVDTSALEDVSRYGLSARWKLSELVFSQQELHVAATALKIGEARHDLLAEVARLFFERKRLLLKRKLEADPDARKRLTIDIEEHTASLDALTAGYLSRHLHRRTP